MGAELFFVNASGESAGEAFNEAVRRARYEHGHGGYSGSIAEKGGFTVIPLPAGEKLAAFVDSLIDGCDHRIDDKWGPAGCVQTGVDSDSGTKEFLFFGWASS